DEAIRGGDRQGALVVLVLRIRHLELRLLREAAIGVARFQLLKELDGLLPFLRVHRVLRLAIEALRRPADRLVLLRRGKQSAAGEPQRGHDGEATKETWTHGKEKL